MGEIADSMINGEFDFITGEYIGEAVGYPRTYVYGRRNAAPVIKKPSSKANVCITNMCKDRGFDSSKKVELVSKFLQSKGYVQLPKLSRQYKIIFNEYKYEFKAYLNSLMKNLLDK
ncbi:hypothetical protein [Phocaeicola vulgatus]|jgi:hypothetical protein|uniref:Uncharacterized protein n=1 Tax=Phocaeicola vulgatus TaxID=821 RepID=A0AAW5BQT3_PHOVU|nr:hypothetical protein [Phocaeicola vulgatus]MCB7020585.1 hypothetical protein [Phocaeicola vulgatus]MCG4690758.1 hypothetical protein [Phocaeicola vulgatus]MCG4731335.1 hypothetical protein [Phocaeicola vulgatus]